MSLESGKYLISAMATEGKNKVGRYWIEDKSLLPKRIILLPETGGPDGWSPEWTIEKKDDGYIMKSLNNYTAGLNGELVAILIPDMAPPQNWKITAQPRHGENVYTIEASDSAEGWVIPEPEELTPVIVRPLIVGASYPPFFPPSELFKIERVDDA
ncbi:hypothetical protein C8Q75DRAFT_806981 [Abortiporus biennis]|nr:hypothetical protein C8Q75DRAFT_806981 [Abortiporus biennis]